MRNFFTDILNPGLLVSLAFGELVKWNKSDTLIRYGDIDTDMYVILSGEVSVLDKKGKDIASLSDGDIVGEVACVRGVPRTATVVAKTDDVYAVRLRADEIQKVIDTEVNPGVAGHGGNIRLLAVKGNSVTIQMGGGCQGCSAADLTLKQGIHTSFRKAVPMVGAIFDETDHTAGLNPYFS